MLLTSRDVRVFTRDGRGGTPVSVFDAADDLSVAEMQRIAATVAAPTTAFAQRPRREGCVARVRAFSPRRELPLEVAPVLAVAALKGAGEGALYELGVLAIRVEPTAHGLAMHMPRTLLGRISIDDRETLASVFALGEADLDPSLPIVSASSGIGVLLVAVRDGAALARASLEMSLWPLLIEKARVVGAMLFTAPTGTEPARARMFSPGTGVDEDLATGSAVAPAAMLLARDAGVRSVCFVQGVDASAELWTEASVLADGGGVVTVAGAVTPGA